MLVKVATGLPSNPRLSVCHTNTTKLYITVHIIKRGSRYPRSWWCWIITRDSVDNKVRNVSFQDSQSVILFNCFGHGAFQNGRSDVTKYPGMSLWPSDAIWRCSIGSTLTQVMACCLMALNHYLKQGWLINNMVLCHSPEDNSTGNIQDFNH